jgi:UDP-glucose 4-epimerase
VIGAEYFNLSNGNGFSVLEVIEACRKLTGLPIQFHINERRSGDPSILVGDSTKARKILKWNPQIRKLDLFISSAWNWILQMEKVSSH